MLKDHDKFLSFIPLFFISLRGAGRGQNGTKKTRLSLSRLFLRENKVEEKDEAEWQEMAFPLFVRESSQGLLRWGITNTINLYFSKLRNRFVKITRFVCPNCKMYLFEFDVKSLSSSGKKWLFLFLSKSPHRDYLDRASHSPPPSICICLNCKMDFSKLPYGFVQISKYICPNFEMYLLKFDV